MSIVRHSMKRIGIVLLLGISAGFAVAPAAEAGVTKIQIISRGPAFGGYEFPGVGPYERIVGRAFGEISPTDRRNKVIVDIDHAPRNANGKVEYAFDFYISSRWTWQGNHKVFLRPPNRGGGCPAIQPVDGRNDRPPAIGSTFLAPPATRGLERLGFSAGGDNADYNLTITLPVGKDATARRSPGPHTSIVTGGRAGRELHGGNRRSDEGAAHSPGSLEHAKIVPSTEWSNNGKDRAFLPERGSP